MICYWAWDRWYMNNCYGGTWTFLVCSLTRLAYFLLFTMSVSYLKKQHHFFLEWIGVLVPCNQMTPGKERCFKLTLIPEKTLWKYKWVKVHPLKSIKWYIYVSDLKELTWLQKIKKLTPFSSVGPRLILVGCKWCFYSGGNGHMW